jgi:CRP-like cAMP-binding protein
MEFVGVARHCFDPKCRLGGTIACSKNLGGSRVTMVSEVSVAQVAPLIDRLRCSDSVSDEESFALANAASEVRQFAARTCITSAHVPLQNSQLLIEGFVSREAELPDGRRRILAIHVPGDFVDLHGFVLKSLDHEVAALTNARMVIFPHVRVLPLVSTHHHLGRVLWFATTVDAAIHREWIASYGRSAVARLAHLFCELRARLAAVGLADTAGYALPITQIDLADATALTPVHVNRTLRQLREAGLIDFRSGRVEIGDLTALERLAGFDPAYLYLNRTER